MVSSLLLVISPFDVFLSRHRWQCIGIVQHLYQPGSHSLEQINWFMLSSVWKCEIPWNKHKVNIYFVRGSESKHFLSSGPLSCTHSPPSALKRVVLELLSLSFSSSHCSYWWDFLQLFHITSTLLSCQPVQHPHDSELVTLRMEAVCFYKTSEQLPTT